jgi:serine/threonine protein kinase
MQIDASVQVDIWSVGCTVIEMATGKMPFHKGGLIDGDLRPLEKKSSLFILVVNTGTLLLKLGNERQAPDIPPELSDNAKDFLAK